MYQMEKSVTIDNNNGKREKGQKAGKSIYPFSTKTYEFQKNMYNKGTCHHKYKAQINNGYSNAEGRNDTYQLNVIVLHELKWIYTSLALIGIKGDGVVIEIIVGLSILA